MRVSFDSNVILYSAGSDDRKADIADALIERGGWISVQVLNEITNVLRKKSRLDWPQVNAFVELVAPLLSLIVLTRDIHDVGRAVAERYKLQVYDGMVASAALSADCDTLYSEDMHHGLMIDGRLRVVNPFLPA